MKCIIFHPSVELYGADKILLYILESLSAEKITIVLPREGTLVNIIKNRFPNINVLIEPNLPIIAKKNFHPSGIFNFIKKIASFDYKGKLNLNQYDLVYLNTLAVLPVLFFTNKQQYKIIHVHEILNNNSFFTKIINKTALRLSSFIFCVSKAVYNNLYDLIPKYNYKLKLIYNGIHDPQKVNVNISTKEKTIFTLIGRFKPSHKGQLFLIEAINLLPKEIKSKSKFLMIGSTVKGQEYIKNDLINKINEYNLSELVEIRDFNIDIDKVYNNVDVVIVPSIFEDPFPTTVLEGMSYSKPVIGTISGGIPEMIVDKETGLLIEKNDIKALANAISFFIENPDMINLMGKKGRTRFENLYTVDIFKNNYSNLINSTLPRS